MITGFLEERPLPVVLQQLYGLRFTGELVINTRTGVVQVYLREGYPVYVNLSESGDLLGRILIEMRVLTEATMRRALATPPSLEGRYGDVLLQLGLCDETQLKQALRAQVRRKLHRLFPVTAGGYAAIPGDHQKGLQSGESLRVHPFRVIYHGVRSFSPERLQALLGGVMGTGGRAFRLLPGIGADVSNRCGFGAEEGHLLDLLRRGFWSFHELTEAAGIDGTLLSAVIYTLHTIELLETGPEGSEPMARDRITDLPPAPTRPEQPLIIDLPPPRRPSRPNPALPSLEVPLELERELAPAGAIPLGPVELAPAGAIPLGPVEPPSSATRVPLAREAPAPSRQTSEPSPASTRSTVPESSQTNIPALGGTGTTHSNIPALGGTATTHSNIPALGGAAQRGPVQRSSHRPVSFEEMALLRADVENKAKVIEDETLFAVLGISPDADEKEVKAAFLQAAKKYHPDRVISMGLQALREQAERIFRRVNEASQVLSDPERRAEYMAELRVQDASGDRLVKEKELAVKAVNAELAFSRGTVYLRKRDYVSASREFDEAARLNPDEGEHLGYAAWTRFCAAKTPLPDSTKEMVRALRMAPKCGRLHYFLGVLYKQDGAEDRAYQSFKKAYELDSRIDEAQSEIRLLDARRSRRSASRAPSSDSRGKSSSDSQKDKPPEKKRGLLDLLRPGPGKKP